YILGLRVVTPDGSLLETGWYNDYRGFNLTDLMVASEGTLGIITEIAVRLIPRPENGMTFLAVFDNPAAAAQTVADIITAGIIPNVLEYIDGYAAELANRYEKTEGIDYAAAVLLMETSDTKKEQQTAQIDEICRKNDCTHIRQANNTARAELLWRVRRNISHAAKTFSRAKISEDIAVPISQFPRLVAFIAELNRSSRLKINSYGHAGDGNLHVNLLSLDGSDEDLRAVEPTVALLLKKALELGGTVTGEHGVGLAKREFLRLEFTPPTLSAMRKIKQVFDPLSLMNPQKLLPD
ncbi:MAG: FAD-binding oxidoreductase, partial [Candidatus Zixiibacteriota bacterium]